MQYRREDRVKVQLTVHKPIYGYPGGPGDYYVAVTGSGLQLGNNDPDKAPRCQPIGQGLWVKDIWPLKNSDIKFKFLVIRRGNNTIVDIEQSGPHNLSVENKPIIVDATFNRPRISATEVEERPRCGPKFCRKIDRKPIKNTILLKDHLQTRDQPMFSLPANTKKEVPMQVAQDRNTSNAQALPQKEHNNAGENKQEDVPLKNVAQPDVNTKTLLNEKEMLNKIDQADHNSKLLLSPSSLKASVMPTSNTFKSEAEPSRAEYGGLESLVQEKVADIKGPLETFSDEANDIQSANTRCYPCTGRKVLLGVAGVVALFGVGCYAFFRK